MIQFFGLQPLKLTRGQKSLRIIIFLLLFMPNFILSSTEIFLTKDIEIRMRIIQMYPSFFIVLTNVINFFIKSRDIDNFFDQTNLLYLEKDAQQYLNKAVRISERIITITATMSFIGVSAGIADSLMTGNFGIPMWMPISGDVAFYGFYAFQTIFLIYGTILLWILDSTVFRCIILLQGYSKYIQMKFKEVGDNEGKINKNDIMALVELHLMFKGYDKKRIIYTSSKFKFDLFRRIVQKYQNSFSNIIIMRGLMSIFCIGSVLFGILNAVKLRNLHKYFNI